MLKGSEASCIKDGNHRRRSDTRDLVGGEVCFDLTADYVGDPAALPVLLDQVDARSFIFEQTEHMTENQHLICFLLGSDW